MIPQDFSVPISESLADAMAKAMACLPEETTPIVVVDSPLAAASLRAALANTGWPGRAQGAPLPWCGTLEQALERAITQIVSQSLTQGSNGNAVEPIGLPRSVALRRVHLAQAMLDFKGLAQSLGGSSKAALDLAGQWLDLFEGWEWLADHSGPKLAATHLEQDLATLRELQRLHQQPNDRVLWIRQHARGGLKADTPASRRPPTVWFCLARSPSPRERAIACQLWGVSDAALGVWLHQPAGLPLSPRAARNLLAATTLEESAWIAAQTLLQWRGEGLQDIGVVALDRKIVRRLRSLLERAGETFSDRSGWALDTTVAATAVSGLNDWLTGQATTQSLLEWVHCPFVRRGLHTQFAFDDQACRRLDETLRGFGRIVPIDIGSLIDQGLLPIPREALSVFGASKIANHRAPLGQWVSALMAALEQCGIDQALAVDHAGQSVLGALQTLQADCADDAMEATFVTAALWQAVLAEALNRARFVEPMPKACIRVVSLSSLTWQMPEAVLLVGADAARLPERPAPQFFEPQRLAEMGLQNTPELMEAERFTQFAALWAAPVPLAVLACSDKPDSDVEFSNWVQLLTHAKPVKAAQAIGAMPLSMNMPGAPAQRPAMEPGALLPAWPYSLPTEITVSQAQSLVNCPYQFVLQQAMSLDAVSDLTEQTEPSDLGSMMHLVLKAATDRFASQVDCERWLEQQIDRILSGPFFADRQAKAVNLPMPAELRARLHADAMALVPGLAKWLASRPQAITEHPVTRHLESAGIALRGRIDRWEHGTAADGGDLLIDFKTTDPKQLAKRVGPQGTDVQLPLYAWLLAADPRAPSIGDVRYACVRRDGVTEIAFPDQPLAQLMQQTVDRVSAAYESLQSGEPISPAGLKADASICDQCSVRGVCRRDEAPYAD